MKKKKIAVLGSTGSIGVQALKIIKEFSEDFELSLISANSSDTLLLEQSLFFQPEHVIINTESGYSYIKKNLRSPIKYYHISSYIGNRKIIFLNCRLYLAKLNQ